MTIYQFEATTLQGEIKRLEEYEGKVLLIVNTASKCGFTPQYKELQKLYSTYEEFGFTVLGFPCDQFMNQEPGSDDEIASFCSSEYGVTFPMFSKINVNGENAHPLFHYLSKEARGILGTSQIKWNFTKFLIDRDGNVVERFSPQTSPSSIENIIKELL